jgi:hypothetical protein
MTLFVDVPDDVVRQQDDVNVNVISKVSESRACHRHFKVNVNFLVPLNPYCS